MAKEAKARGFKGKRGKVPTAYSVQKILTRTQYCGYNIFCGEVYKGDYEPIIDIETYNKVLALLKRQGKTVGRKRIEPFVKISS